MTRAFQRCSLGAALALLAGLASARDIPLADPGQAAVRDVAQVLSAEQALALRKAAQALREETAAAIAVVTIESKSDYGGSAETIEAFTRRLYAQWAPGRPSTAPARTEAPPPLVLLLVARLDGLAWIEPPANWDDKSRAACRDILAQHVQPALRRQEYAQAVITGVAELDKLARQVQFAARLAGRPAEPVAATAPADEPAPVIGASAALRHLAAAGKQVWAVGDRGLILRSDDAGLTWRRIRSPLTANFQQVYLDPPRVYVFGGRAVAGQPEGLGQSVILRSDDGERFRPLPGPPTGWLYGGAAIRDAILAFGQASPACPGGIWRSVTAGRTWQPLNVSSAGYVCGGGFLAARYGYVVGQDQRIVSLRNLAEPSIHPAEAPAKSALLAAAMLDERSAFAAGQAGTVLASQEPGRPWRLASLPLPAGTRRLADFEAVAVAPPAQVWVGGGLTGAILYSDNRGATWQRRPAPAGGALRAMLHVGAGADAALLACGDAGHVWRSTDGGRSWTSVLGKTRCDVLFVAAAGDRSIFPALTAHALAGLEVAVVFATDTDALGGAPGSQHLRAAAIQAGAAAACVLDDFPSVVAAGNAEGLREADLLGRWSQRLDAPAQDELLRQLSAAIRLYRPLVLAVGPDGEGPKGVDAENRLVARLARQAARLAAQADAHRELLAVGLAPHVVRRTVVGFEENQQTPLFRDDAPRIDRARADAWVSGPAMPAGRNTTIELLAQEALWQLPWTGPADRPGLFSAYRCESDQRLGTLFTRGLADASLAVDAPEQDLLDLAGGLTLRLAAGGDRESVALGLIASAAERHPGAASLAADRALLLYLRMLRQGKIVPADQAWELFEKLGVAHPLRRRMAADRLAQEFSAEWRAARRELLRPADRRAELARAVKRLDDLSAWTRTAPGRFLQAKVYTAAGRGLEAMDLLSKLCEGAYDPLWQRLARVEAGIAPPSASEAALHRHASAQFASEPGRIDGHLDEPVWAQTPAVALLDAQGKLPDMQTPAADEASRETPGPRRTGATLPASPSAPRDDLDDLPVRREGAVHAGGDDADAKRRADIARMLDLEPTGRTGPSTTPPAPRVPLPPTPQPPPADRRPQTPVPLIPLPAPPPQAAPPAKDLPKPLKPPKVDGPMIVFPPPPPGDDKPPYRRERPRGPVQAAFHVVRSQGDFLIFALQLPERDGRIWSVDLAIDSDRDGWTQLVVGCDSLGKRWARLEAGGEDVTAQLEAAQTFMLQGQREDGQTTLELALPVRCLSAEPLAGVVSFQLRAVADDHGRRTTLYFQPQDDDRLLPHRYGLLRIPPARN